MRTLVMALGVGLCHARQIRHVSTMSLIRRNALRGAPANLRISVSLAAEACQNRIWSLQGVLLTTASSVLRSSLNDRLKSRDVHSALPPLVCVSESTPLERAAGECNPSRDASPLAASSRRRSIGCSAASSASSSAGGSTAGLRIGALGPAGARGTGGADLAHGSCLRVPGATGSGSGTTFSGASGAGAPGLTISSRAVVRDDADACEPLRIAAPVPGRPTPCIVEFLGLDTRQALRCAYRNLHLLLLGSLGKPTPVFQCGGIGSDLESDCEDHLLPLDSLYTLCSSQPCL